MSSRDAGTPIGLGMHVRAIGEVDLEVNVKGNRREVEGIAVPYNKPTVIDPSLIEQFESGFCEHQRAAMHRISACWEHAMLGGTLVGHTIHFEDTSEGLLWRSKIAKTRDGDDVLGLVEAGSLRQLSIGFRGPIKNRLIRSADGQVIKSRVQANLFEVAFVREGAYGEFAEVNGMRALLSPSGEILAGPSQFGVEEDVTEQFEQKSRRMSYLAELNADLEAMNKRAAGW